jgi:hypothetical protein
MSDIVLGDDPAQVAAAFHRLYVESLPYDQRVELTSAAPAALSAMSLESALGTIAQAQVSRLLKVRSVASALRRRPQLVNSNRDGLAGVIVAALRIPADTAAMTLTEIANDFQSGRRDPDIPLDGPGRGDDGTRSKGTADD